MKQNAVSLASICVLSTIVIMTIASTLSLYIGCNDVVRQQCPRQINMCISSMPTTSIEESQILFHNADGQMQQTFRNIMRLRPMHCIAPAWR